MRSIMKFSSAGGLQIGCIRRAGKGPKTLKIQPH